MYLRGILIGAILDMFLRNIITAFNHNERHKRVTYCSLLLAHTPEPDSRRSSRVIVLGDTGTTPPAGTEINLPTALPGNSLGLDSSGDGMLPDMMLDFEGGALPQTGDTRSYLLLTLLALISLYMACHGVDALWRAGRHISRGRDEK